MRQERTGLFFMTEEKENKEAQPEEDSILKTLQNCLEMHKKTPLRAIFICMLTEDKQNHSTSAGKKGTELEILGALDMAHTNIKMDWIMQSKAKEVLGALLQAIKPEEETVIH